MIIKVDYREKSFIQKYEDLFNNESTISTVTFQTSNLDLGDIHICDDNDNIILIFERKTVNDLMSSIKDGRYKEQSYRLNSLDIHNHSIIYVIEGTVSNGNIHNNIPTLYSSMCSLQLYKGFSIFKTNTVKETVEYIYFYACKLQKEGNKPLFYSGEICNNTSYVDVVHQEKKNNITPDNIGTIMLCNIPYISSVTAKTIMNKYKTIYGLINSITEDPTCLDTIVIESNNKQRKISKKVIENIKKFLIPE